MSWRSHPAPRLAALAAAIAAGSAFAQPAQPPTEEQSLALGKAVVERNCSQCHAVGRAGSSPNPNAPAFRDMSRRLDVEQLGEGLAQGILTEHPAMPEFRLTPPEIIGVIRYLRAIQQDQRASAGRRAATIPNG
jgi:mono/diheme cytochrome c family protein